MEYDSMIDDNPIVQEHITRAIARAELKELRRVIVDIVQDKYPSLRKLAKKRVSLIDKPGELRQLVRLINTVPNKKLLRWLLNNF